MARRSLGDLLKSHRLARELTQEQVAAVLGITRQRYGQIEGGAGAFFEPERARKLVALLRIDMLELCQAMGYPISTAGLSPRATAVARAWEKVPPSVQDYIAEGLGVET